ncbi:ABC transporter permease [Salinicoccus hispanicus]|uniref:ABC transporter permease n=1 Tax=Salinicoccus hispanicus TaxID=157225 RepID=UPI001B866C19|nr:hypothetical protein [Salinicoccus hispanicus]
MNRTLLNHFMGGIFWLTVLFLIGNILIQPLYLWIRSVNSEPVGNMTFISGSMLNETLPFQLAASMIYVVLMVMFLFSYKHKEASLDFMHSMPVKRRKLLSHALIAGVINIIIPLVITAVILFFERYFLIFDITIMEIVEWFFYTLFVLLVVFAISVFVGFLVNSMFVHMQLVVIVFFLPVVFWGLTVSVADLLYDGIAPTPSTGGDGLMGVVVNNTFPIFAIQQIIDGFTLWKMIIWIGIAVVLIILSYLYYNRSRSENVHQTFNNGWIRDILVAFITISGMLLVGLVISFALPNLTVVYVFAFVIGAIFSYITQEMFFQGTAKINFRWRSILISAISVVVFWIVFIIGWQQYTSYVPDQSSVESVSINGNWSSNNWMSNQGESIMTEDYLFIEDKNVISEGVALHQEAITNEGMPESGVPESFEIIYKMQDGSYVNRSYDNISMENEKYQSMMETLNSGEYSKVYDVVYNIEDSSEINNLELYGIEGYINLESSVEIAEFTDAYQKAAHQVDTEMPMLTNNSNASAASASLSTDGNYYNGNVSIYNPALINKVTEDQNLAEFLGIGSSQNMHTVSLSDDAKESFFRDYETMSFDELSEKYDVESLDDREDVINSINNGGLDASGDKVLLYSPEYMGMEMDVEEVESLADAFIMLGIE